MIGKNRQAASDQHRNEKEVEKVAVAHPQRKPMRTGEIVGIYLRDRRDMWEPYKKKLDPGTATSIAAAMRIEGRIQIRKRRSGG